MNMERRAAQKSAPGIAGILLPNVTAAALMAVMNITMAFSLAALIFSGPLAPYLSTGIAIMLVGTAVGGALVAAGSSFKGILAAPRSAHAPVLAAMALAIHAAMAAGPKDAMLATVTASLLVAVVVSGLLLYLTGYARLGGLVRYIPFPVMGGFFAGVGFHLVTGGMSVALGPVADLGHPGTLLTWDSLFHLGPALAFGWLFYSAEQRIHHWLLLPAFLIVGIAFFYGILVLNGVSVQAAAEAHWLPVIQMEQADFLPVLGWEQLRLIQWPLILEQIGPMVVMGLISLIILLLDISGIEIIIDQDMDPDRELKVAGIANGITGLLGGAMSIQCASDTAFTFKLGGDRYLMALTYAALAGGVLFAGPSLITVVPTWILGGLLVYLGIEFLMVWVWKARRDLPLTDYAVVLCILAVVAVNGILEGVGVGIVLSIFLFVHSYSKLSVIKADISGAEHVSNVDRHPRERALLDQRAEQIHIFVLQGFLFFGTASRLLEEIRNRLNSKDRPALRYMVLDFKHVDALDTSAVNTFSKLVQICDKGGVSMVFTGCASDVEQRLRKLDTGNHPDDHRCFCNRLDDGVAWCEKSIIHDLDTEEQRENVASLLTQLLNDPDAVQYMAACVQPVPVSAGETLFKQGDPGNSLYMVLGGAVTVVLELPDAPSLRLRTFRTGAIFGEMALYTGAPRSASAVVDEDGLLGRLDLDAFKRLEQEHPQATGTFHAHVVRMMADRLAQANKQIMALSR